LNVSWGVEGRKPVKMPMYSREMAGRLLFVLKQLNTYLTRP
jgi:hypothetical protein